MFIIWIVWSLVEGVRVRRARHRAARFVIGFDPARADGSGTVVVFDSATSTVVESWEVRQS